MCWLQVGKTGAKDERLKEASNINTSLSQLGLVITRLTTPGTGPGGKRHIPYRDSK
mgnify:CR=1 FL=1